MITFKLRARAAPGQLNRLCWLREQACARPGALAARQCCRTHGVCGDAVPVSEGLLFIGRQNLRTYQGDEYSPFMTNVANVQFEVPRGWLDYVTAWATVAAALLALAAIVYAVAEAKRGNARLRRERRLYYELGLLQKLSEIIPGEDRSAVLRRQIIGLLSALPGADLPLLRAFVNVRAPQGADARLDAITRTFADRHPEYTSGDKLQFQWNALAYPEEEDGPEWAKEVNEAIRIRLDQL
jgi:hypothetical protein